MADIIVPELAESITEGELVRWVKNVGDTVEKGEFIVELETDKVNAEIISEEAGVLVEILAQEGDVVEVGAVIAKVDPNGTASAPAARHWSDNFVREQTVRNIPFRSIRINRLR